MTAFLSKVPSHYPAMRLTSGLLFLCGMVLCFDVGGELHALLQYPASVSPMVLFHLGTELAATLGVGLAFALIRANQRRALADHQADRDAFRRPGRI